MRRQRAIPVRVVAQAPGKVLPESDPSLRTITDALPVLVACVGADGLVHFANRTCEAWLGRTGAEIIGRPLGELLGPPMQATLAPAIAEVFAGRSVVHEHALPRPEGGERLVEATYVPHRDGDDVLGFTILLADVTEKKRQEARRAADALRTERLLVITAAIADAVTPEEVHEAVVDQVATATGASSAALWLVDLARGTARLERSVGYTDAACALLGECPLDSAAHHPAIETLRSGTPLWFDSQEALLAEYPGLRRHLTPAPASRVACLPLTVGGRTLASLAFSFDDAPALDGQQRGFLELVARYSGQALERLRLNRDNLVARERSELLYRLVYQVVATDQAGDVFEAALGAIEGALGARRSAILVLDEGGVARFRAWHGLSEAYRTGMEGHSLGLASPRQGPVLIPDVAEEPRLGRVLPLLAHEQIRSLALIPLVASGQPLGMLVTYHDAPHEPAPGEVVLATTVASHVSATLARLGALGELERTVQFSEMFTGILGQDLRHPLGAILASAELALKRSESVRLIKPLARILNSGERMERMIQQLLAFSRVRLGGGIPVQPRHVDLVPLLAELLGELDDANPGWTLRLEHTGETTGEWDGDRLAQLFSNLAGNAVEHGRAEGGVLVRIDGTAPDLVLVSVHNEGVVPPELLDKLFEPLAGGARPRRGSGGLGLGLFISRQIACAHGGWIGVRSSEAAGTTFTVTLPRAASAK